ncbi:MAG: hypothetical protein V1908_03860 [Candidatus Peregrinibacteria bacterium]
MSTAPEQVNPNPDKPTIRGMLERLAAEVGQDHIVADAGRPAGTPVIDAAVARYEGREAKEAIPEWTKEEVERLADAHVLLSQYRLNPSFWGYVHSVGWETDVYTALDAMIAYPHLFYYRELGSNKTEIIPRTPGLPDANGTESLVIEGGLKDGCITQIKIAGKTLKLENPKANRSGKRAYQPWKEYLENIRTLSGVDTTAQYEGGFPRETTDYKQLETEFAHRGPRLLKALLEARAKGRLGGLVVPGASSNLQSPTDNVNLQSVFDSLTPDNHGERYETIEEGGSLLGVLVYMYEKGVNEGVIEITKPITQEDDDASHLPMPLVAYTPDGLIVGQKVDADGIPMRTTLEEGDYPIYEQPGKDGMPTVRDLMLQRYEYLVPKS